MHASEELSGPNWYEIRVEGDLDERWAVWFQGMALSVENHEDGRTITTMWGPVADRAALHGLLSRIRDLCLHLLFVQRVDSKG